MQLCSSCYLASIRTPRPLFYLTLFFSIQIRGEPLTNSNIRETYMKFPLVHVKVALQRVPDFTFVLPACVQKAYSQSKAKYGLNYEEAAAIHIYTAQCDVYRSLNAALRSQQLNRIEPWFSYLKLFQTAIEKLRTSSQLFCRGEPEDFSSSLTIGSTVTWWATTSLSRTLAACMEFLHKDKKSGTYTGVLYWVRSSSAQSIRDFSEYPKEDEYLLLPGATLRMTKRIRSAYHYGVYEVDMEEINAPASDAANCTKSPHTMEKPTIPNVPVGDSLSDQCVKDKSSKTLIIILVIVFLILSGALAFAVYFFTKKKYSTENTE